ncbi:MAG TPA: type II toxin-antitoxin system HicA family toxin [Candidatus Dormibacteraeota bacterium]|nr:type II toxin-antitoxin system HicA family toxin [Candidatus Dormibacteraeota bacterium]
MPRLPRVTGDDALRALRRAGWREARRRGSHIVLRNEARPGRLVVPVHAGTILKPKTLLSILDQAGIDADQFRGLL